MARPLWTLEKLAAVATIAALVLTLAGVGPEDVGSLRESSKSEPLVDPTNNRHLVQTETCFGPEGRGLGTPTLYFPREKQRAEEQSMVQCEHPSEAPTQKYSFRLPHFKDGARIEDLTGVFGIDQEEQTAARVSWEIRYRGRVLCDVTLRNTQTGQCESDAHIPAEDGASLNVTQEMVDSASPQVYAGIIEPAVGWSEPTVLSRWYSWGLVILGLALFLWLRKRRRQAPV